MISAFPLIIFTAILNTIAQILLKAGMDKIGEFSFTLSNIAAAAEKVIYNPFIIFGLITYTISVSLWLLVLSRVSVSVAYPLSSISYIFAAIAAYYCFGEQLSLLQVLGIFTIIFGVYLMTQH